jgi:uncharacterized protein (DUF1800 family)
VADRVGVVDAQTLHLLRRATYGPTPALLAQAAGLGRVAWLERQLAPSSIADPTMTTLLKRFPKAAWSIAQIRAVYGDSGSWDAMEALTQATVARSIWSERQLFELMVEFWSNHLNVTNPSSDVWDSRCDYDRSVIRRDALGSFSDLLVAATQHPAMQRYLDNASSTKSHPNENHGRELLELHTLGVGAGYTEIDVQNSARILTGLTVDDAGHAVYRPERHYVGAVRVLDFTDPNPTAAGGRDVAVGYLRWLARHPATATSIARKLALRFVCDTPSAALIDVLSATYLEHDTQIVPVLRELFGSDEFAASALRKVRRPYEKVVATVRALGLRPDSSGIDGIQALGWTLADLGHAPMAWDPPNGYPDVAAAWQSPAGTLAGWNANLNIAARWWPKTLAGPALSTMVGKKRPATHGALIDVLANRLLQRKASTAQKSAICAFLTEEWATIKPSTPLTKDSAAIGWRLPYVVALLLDSPEQALR